MTTSLAVLFVVVVVLFVAYNGAREGAFFSAYNLCRNLLGFLFAMTLCRPTSMLLSVFISRNHPAPSYFTAISFLLIFAAVVSLGRWWKLRTTFPGVECPAAVEWIAGGALGLLSGVVLTGTVLVLWCMLPFGKYLPRDMGRIDIRSGVLDTGAIMLRFYDHLTDRMPGNSSFLLRDEPMVEDADDDGLPDPGDKFDDQNGNGEWDRGWLWKYSHAADIRPSDLVPLKLPEPAEEEEEEPGPPF